MLQRYQDFGDVAINPFRGHAKKPRAKGLKLCLPLGISEPLLRLRVDTAVLVDREPQFVSVEIQHGTPNCVLAAELVAVQLSSAQHCPQRGLGWR